MQLKEKYRVKIEKMLNGGNSLARIDNFPIFITGGCPSDFAEIEIIKINKNFAEGKITQIINPSEYRTESVCPYYKICGSCDWLYINYSEQLKQKQNIVYETIKNITGKEYKIEPVIPSPKIKEYRCKVQVPVGQTKVSKRILSGYYKRNTHELINIKYCKMQDKSVNELIEYIKISAQELGIEAYNEKTHTGKLRHILIRKSAFFNEILVILTINDNTTDNKIKNLAEKIISKYDNIKGVCVNFNNKKTNVILGSKTVCIKGNDCYFEQINNIKYKITAESFFQINTYCAELLFSKIKEIIKSKIENPVVLDAYSGVSAIGIQMSDIARKVISVEESKSATECAKYNAQINKINNIEIINSDASKAFEELINNKAQIDISITDPPRKGCSENSVKYLSVLTKKYIIYVSCNISTLARDIKLFELNNFIPIYIQPVDMFPNTYHIETIAVMERQNKKEA